MKYVLIEIPKADHKDIYKFGSWGESKRKIEELNKQNKDFELLPEGVLLIPLRNGLGMLPPISQALVDVPYRYKVLDGEPQWHEGPMGDDIQGR